MEECFADISDLSCIERHAEIDCGHSFLFGREAVDVLEDIEDREVGQRVDGGVEDLKGEPMSVFRMKGQAYRM